MLKLRSLRRNPTSENKPRFNARPKTTALRRFGPRYESLEQRVVLAASAVVQGGVLTVTGTSGEDTIVVAATGNPNEVSVNINAVDFGAFTAASAKVSGLGGGDELVVSGIPATVIGGGGDDRYVGPDVDNQLWQISGSNSGYVAGVQFSQIERVKGGALPDIFQFLPGGSISGRVEGNDGFDYLDYSQLSGPVSINEISHKATGIGGTYFGIENLTGSASLNDKLTNNRIFILDDTNGGATRRSDAVSSYLRYTSIENLASTEANEFKFFSIGAVTGKITAGPGSYLNYSQSGITEGVNVNLVNGTASRTGGISGIRDVYGTIGPDILFGDSKDNHFWGNDGNDLLVGGSGNDELDGGSNQDLVIGGDGDDLLNGGTGEDIVIGGAGSDTLAGFDGNDVLVSGKSDTYDPAKNSSASGKLQLLRAEWTRTDAGYSARIDHLTNGTGLTGGNKLNSSTISDDNATDTLTGGLGNDWFIIGKSKDTVVDKDFPSTEVVTKI